MGGLGGGSSGGKSGNKNLDFLNDTFKPMAGGAPGGMGAMGNILGLNGSGASSQALDDYYNSSGGKFQLEQGMDALDSKFAGLGLSRSGAAMKGMEQFRSDLMSTKLDNFLGHLGRYSQLGLGAGNLLANAGQYSKGAGGGGGLGSILGAGLSMLPYAFPSSRDLKDDIEVLGPWDDRGDGLEKVAFRYKWEPKGTRHVGVIAEDVKRLRPSAYIPDFYMGKPGVNYAALSEAA